MTSVLSYSNRANGAGVFTAVTGTWDSARPLSHMGTIQVPVPFAQVTPEAGVVEFTFQAQDAAGNPETFDARLFALLAVTDASQIAYTPGLPDNAVIEFRDNSDDTLLASVTWTANGNRPANAYALASTAASLNTLKVRIEDAGEDPIRIGGLWAGEVVQWPMLAGWPVETRDYGSVTRAGATPWPNRRDRGRLLQVQWERLTEDQAIGTSGGVNAQDLFQDLGTSRPVIVIPRTANQAAINTTAVYGLPNAPGRVQHIRGPHWRAELDVLEVR